MGFSVINNYFKVIKTKILKTTVTILNNLIQGIFINLRQKRNGLKIDIESLLSILNIWR